jgi:hypothetical protein
MDCRASLAVTGLGSEVRAVTTTFSVITLPGSTNAI